MLVGGRSHTRRGQRVLIDSKDATEVVNPDHTLELGETKARWEGAGVWRRPEQPPVSTDHRTACAGERG
jgi:hypothetical protein